MNEELWKKIIDFIGMQQYPELPCPYCGDEALTIDSETILFKKVQCERASIAIRSEQNKQIDLVKEIYSESPFWGILFGAGVAMNEAIQAKEPSKFTSFFKCGSCQLDVAATGSAQVFITKQSGGIKKEPLIKVEYFSPPIPMFSINENIPQEIKLEVLQAFNHFHSDLTSSGVKIRRAIEKVCQDLGYEGKNLNRKIDALAKDWPDEGEYLHCLRVLGNDASHSDSVCDEDILNGFLVLEGVLAIYDQIRQRNILKERSLKLKEKFSPNVMPKALPSDLS